MSSLASMKYVRRLLMATAAMASICFSAGCGSGSPFVTPLGGSYSNANLSGTYVMKQSGWFANSAGNAQQFSETTIFTANGSGTLAIVEDDGGPQGPGPENIAGTYTIQKDGEGSLTFNNPTASIYQITMIDSGHFYVIEGDSYSTSAGYGALQTSTTIPSGPFVFKSHIVDISSRVGEVTISGNAFTGAQDILNLNSLSAAQTITGVVTTPNTLGIGTFTLADGTAFNYYTISPTEFSFMSSTGSLEIGQAVTQTAITLAAGTYVFGSRGDTSVSGPAGIHSAGVFTTDGNGNITGGAADYVQDGNVQSNLTLTGTYTITGNGNGTINLSLSNNSTISQIFWMVSPTNAYFLANSSTAVEDGTFVLQSGAPFSALTSQASFVMDGVDTNFKDRVGVFVQTSSTAFNWNQTSNSGGVGATSLGTNGTYAVGSNGRVTAVVNDVTASGANPGVVFYLSSPNAGFMVQEDGNDIGGVFTLQASQ
jgi:hypothetical protein